MWDGGRIISQLFPSQWNWVPPAIDSERFLRDDEHVSVILGMVTVAVNGSNATGSHRWSSMAHFIGTLLTSHGWFQWNVPWSASDSSEDTEFDPVSGEHFRPH